MRDLVGGRVVCNNVKDVYRFEALLRESLPFQAGPVERQDYIQTPKNGYRALHLNFRLHVGKPLARQAIPCEAQIRSRLQDAWAELTHTDIYKHDDLPPTCGPAPRTYPEFWPPPTESRATYGCASVRLQNLPKSSHASIK